MGAEVRSTGIETLVGIIAFVVFVSVVVLLGAWLSSVWIECRDAGFSRAYCARMVL